MLAAALIVLPATTQAQQIDAGKLSAIVFSGLDIEPFSAFLSSGGKLSLPLDNASKVFVLGASGVSLSDLRLVREGKLERRAVASEARLFVGVERSFGPLYLSAGVGPAIAQYVDRRGAAIRRAGVTGQIDGWYRPSADQAVHTAALFDSSQRSMWMRLRYGYRPAALPAYFGPEISYGSSRGTQKFKLGMHASEIRLGPAVFTVSGGAMWEQGRPGVYVGLGGYAGF